MDYIHEAENYLRYYREMQKSLEWQEIQIVRLKWEGYPGGCNAISYDGMPKGSGNKDEAINIAFKLKMLMDSHEETEKELNEIDKILDNISRDKGCELYGEVLRLWYIEKVPKEEIADRLNYSSRTSIYDIKNEALKKFAASIFGVFVVRSI